MIKRLYVDNYKCLVNFDLELRELSLLLGRNGSGKSSVLEVVYSLRRLLSGEVKVTDRDVFPTLTLTKGHSVPVQRFEVVVELGSSEYLYSLEVGHDVPARRPRITREVLTKGGDLLFSFEDGTVQLYADDCSKGPAFPGDWEESALARAESWHANQSLSEFLDLMRRIMVCAVDPGRMRAEASSEDRVLDRDAGNFAAWYRNALLEWPGRTVPLRDALAEVIDGFDGMRLVQAGLDTRALMVDFRWERGLQRSLWFDEWSDGQRKLICLYALLHLAGEGCTFFVDEPDNFVTLPEIQPWLMELSDACGSGVRQAVLCSHHPELIDYLGADCGVVFALDGVGHAAVRAPEPDTEQAGLRMSELIARGWEQ